MRDVPIQSDPAVVDPTCVVERTTQLPEPIIYAINDAFDPSRFFGGGTPKWNFLETDSRAALVKDGRQRRVWRVTLPHGQFVYAKVFDDSAGSIVRWCKRTFRLHPLMREWNALVRLQSLDVSAVRPIALAIYPPSIDAAASRHGATRSHRLILLTEGIENSKTLIAAWNDLSRLNSPHVRTVQARMLIASVAELWAMSHERGYWHPDGHPGNILIRFGATSERSVGRAVFIDPARSMISILRSKPASRKEALYSLVMLDQFFHRSATRTQRLRFWRDYWVQRGILFDGVSERRILGRLVEIAALHQAALARQRDRRLRGDGKYFGQLRLKDGWKATVVLRLERRHVFPEAEVPDRSTEQWASVCLHVLRVQHGSTFVAKGIRLVRRPENCHGPWAEKLFRHAHRLRHRDIQAPLILGYLQNKGLAGIRDEYLILPE